MNKISTLFAFACALFFGSTAWAQTTSSFNTAQEVAQLKAACWNFSSFVYTSTNPEGTDGNVTTPVADLPTITTNLLSKPTGDLIVSFSYRVIATKPGVNTIKADVWGDGIAYTNNIDVTRNLNAGNQGTVSFTLAAKNVPNNFSVVISASNMSVEIDNLSINANYVPGSCIGLITMPVKLMNFQGAVASNKAQLQWSVADNETGSYFQVLRSTDGKNFTESATLFLNTKVGVESYSFTDSKELAPVTYYKLKIVNKDGSASYSNVIILKNTTEAGSKLTILQNPVASTLNFSYTSASTTQSNINIYSTTGVKVYSSRMGSHKGLNTVSLNVDRHLAAGTYVLEVVNGVERTVTRLVKK